MKRYFQLVAPALFALPVMVVGCGGGAPSAPQPAPQSLVEQKVERFVEVPLTADISHLTDSEKQMLPLLYKAADIMDDLFWREAFGDRDALLAQLPDEAHRAFARINYGPWERLADNTPFAEGYGPKPLGANFYPADMTNQEYEACTDALKGSMYTLLQRDAEGKLVAVPYHVAFRNEVEKAASLLEQAATMTDNQGLQNYLKLRAQALRTDEYLASDLAWMDMKTNNLDFVVGPIENYEDTRFGRKAAHEAFLLIRDVEWSKRLERYAALLPKLQRSLPVDEAYKMEQPGSDSDLGVYDVVYYAGDCNAGSKTIAINLPNDPEVHIQKGSRKLQLRNAMQLKFEHIMQPIAELLIEPAQRKHVTFKAFFENTMFHEVAHGLGIKNTINGKGSVHEAMAETYSAIEEGKADILGVFMIEQLVEMGELTEHDLMDNYVTFLAGIFRSVRFGAASAHGKANMIRFHFFQEHGAFTRNAETGLYSINPDKMRVAVAELARAILVMQGDGNYDLAKRTLAEQGVVTPELQGDLDRIAQANIPLDLRYTQGPQNLGLTAAE